MREKKKKFYKGRATLNKNKAKVPKLNEKRPRKAPIKMSKENGRKRI